jgi:hypothetical protein
VLARGWLSLHTACPERGRRVYPEWRRAPFPGQKCFAAKSPISISSKLIEIKRLQVQYPGHLRKTGGRGSYQLFTRHPIFPPHSPLVYPERSRRARPPQLQRRRVTRLLLSTLFPLHTSTSLVCLLFPLLTQKQGEEVSLAKTLSCCLACFGCSLKNVGAPTFLIFPLIFRTFLPLTGLQHDRGKEEKSLPRKFGRDAKCALPDPVGTGARPAPHWE